MEGTKMTAALLPGDYGVVPIGGDVGQLIRFGQWLNGSGFANYEHAVVNIGGGLLVEAEPGGARTRPITEYANTILWSSGHFDPTIGQRAKIVSAAIHFSNVAVSYSFLDYLALFAHRLHLPVPGLRRYIASTGHEICSALVDACYQFAGIQLFPGEWDGYVTPGMLYDLIKT
jgi:hypothetical protein